jgi:Ser/Thr protein kinase RdoA (MazF antagonist)
VDGVQKTELTDDFYSLTVDHVLDCAEEVVAGHGRTTGRAMALNSLENRVYQIEFDDGVWVVAKFYRPGRWTAGQITEEHNFLRKLKELEIPVIAPQLGNPQNQSKVKQISASLYESNKHLMFTVFPFVKGRLRDELDDKQLETLGRYLGRIHRVGQEWKGRQRLTLNVEQWGYQALDTLMDGDLQNSAMAEHYEAACLDFLEIAEARLTGVRSIMLHGDCHLGNTLWQDEAPFFLDFDDAMRAPAVQDIWMVVRGRDEEAVEKRKRLLHSYESMCEFNWEELALIEVLRGLRVIHYSAWIQRRLEDPSFQRAFPHFGSEGYWRDEIESLREMTESL